MQAILVNRGDVEPRLALFDVQRVGETDEPMLAPFFPPDLAVNHFKLAVRVTKNPFEDGKVMFNNDDDTWDLWLWHPMPLDIAEDRYVVYFNKSPRDIQNVGTSSFSTRSDIAVFRQALNRTGLTLMSIKLREDKFGLYGVF